MHILGAQHASDPANPKSTYGLYLAINGCSDIGAARHAHQLDSLFDVLVLGCRVKGVSEMHILGAQERVGRYQSGRVTNGRRFGKA